MLHDQTLCVTRASNPKMQILARFCSDFPPTDWVSLTLRVFGEFAFADICCWCYLQYFNGQFTTNISRTRFACDVSEGRWHLNFQDIIFKTEEISHVIMSWFVGQRVGFILNYPQSSLCWYLSLQRFQRKYLWSQHLAQCCEECMNTCQTI
jgi:hypothetical protein